MKISLPGKRLQRDGRVFVKYNHILNGKRLICTWHGDVCFVDARIESTPSEMEEEILLAHPDVQDAAVFSIHDFNNLERTMAVVVLEPSISNELPVVEDRKRSIMNFYSRSVFPHKYIHRFEVVKTIPRTSSGKTLRQQLTQEFSKGFHYHQDHFE